MTAYNHSNKAGNIGDVVKHLTLVGLLNRLVDEKRKTHSKDYTFGYLETHSGGDYHNLSENGEHQTGVGKLVDAYLGAYQSLGDGQDTKDYNEELLEPYMTWVLGLAYIQQVYPSSWMMAHTLLQNKEVPNHTLTLFDTSAEVAKIVGMYKDQLEAIKFFPQDGFQGLKEQLGYRTDFVFIDPPYKTSKGEKLSKDWVKAKQAADFLTQKGVPFAIWCPYFTAKNTEKLYNSLTCERSMVTLVNHDAPQNNRVLKGASMILGNIPHDLATQVFAEVSVPLTKLGEVTLTQDNKN